MIDDKDPIHDQLIKAYLDYFKANEQWERKRSVRAYAAVQQKTKLIRQLAKARNEEIREQYQADNPALRKDSHKRYQ